jgi:hypothetical protein
VPAVLAAERVEHRVLHDREPDRLAERPFELGVDQPVECGERAPAARADLDGVVRDAHGDLLSRC